MDPNFFHLDWERTAEVLAGIVVLALLLERALALLFESRFFINRFSQKSLKELIAFGLAVLVCWRWDFDAISTIFLTEQTTKLGIIITGGIVAGGSKGSIKLFRDFMGFKSTAQDIKEKQDKAKTPKQGGGDK